MSMSTATSPQTSREAFPVDPLANVQNFVIIILCPQGMQNHFHPGNGTPSIS